MGRPKNIVHITPEQLARGEKYHVTLDEKAKVEQSYTDINTISGKVEQNTSNTLTLSSNLNDNQDDINYLSGKTEDVYSTVESNSALWNLSGSTSAIVDLTYISGRVDDNTNDISIIGASSGDWNDVYSTVGSNSAQWSQGNDNKLSGYVTLDTDQTITSNKIIDGNVRINGTFTATSAIIINSEQIALSANYIDLNNNVNGIPTEDAGVKVIRGNEPASLVEWDETNDRWRAGISGNLSTIVLSSDLNPLWEKNTSGNIVPRQSNDILKINDIIFNKLNSTTDQIITSTNGKLYQTNATIVDLSSVLSGSLINIDIFEDLPSSGNLLHGDTFYVEKDLNTVELYLFNNSNLYKAELNISGGSSGDSGSITGYVDDDIDYLSGQVSANSINIDNLSSSVDINTSSFENFIPLSGSSDISGNLTPSLSTLTLGTSSNPWKEGYFSSGSLYLGSDQVHTSGNYLYLNDEILYPIPVPTYYNDTSVITVVSGGGISYGTGEDGDVSITGSVVINQYAGLPNTLPGGTSTIPVDDASGFSVGMEIMIIQIQTYLGGVAGTHEFLKISEINGNDITVEEAPINTYYSSLVDTEGPNHEQEGTRTQIVSIPNYNNVQLDGGIGCPEWDGAKGGIILFKVKGDITGTGTISVQGKGFRNGYRYNSYDGGSKCAGEGIRGFGFWDRESTSHNYGGGSYRKSLGYSAFAGDGSHVKKGMDYVSDEFGYSIGSEDLSKYPIFGGGGGSTYGGAGGGIIMLWASTCSFAGTLYCGGGHKAGSGDYGDGAGGSIAIFSSSAPNITTVLDDPHPTKGYGIYKLIDAVPKTADLVYKPIPSDSSKVDKVVPSASGNIPTLNLSGELYDSTINIERLNRLIPLSGSDQISGNLTPALSSLTLGTSANPWKEGYFTSGSLYLGDKELHVSGNYLAFNEDILVPIPVPTVDDNDKYINVEVITYGDVGDGSDGDLTVPADTTIIVNKYSGINGDINEGDLDLTIDLSGNINDFSVGQEIMIIQSQSYRQEETLGTYEFKHITAINGNTITVDSGLLYNYYSDSDGNKSNNTKTQIVTVPHYNSTYINTNGYLSCDQWNGYCGGILVFRNKLDISGPGNISAKVKGYRSSNIYYAGHNAGEGYIGTNWPGDSVENHGGGGYNNGYNEGGGGGHKTAGADNQGNTQGGRIFGSDDVKNNLTFGGAGGISHAADPNTYNGSGGGIIYIASSSCTIDGKIDVGGVPFYYGRSAGAGGSIALFGFDASGITVLTRGYQDSHHYGADGYYQNYISEPPEINLKYTDSGSQSKIDKVIPSASGNIPVLNLSGELYDSNINIDSLNIDNWDSTYSTVSANSADWELSANYDSEINTLSGDVSINSNDIDVLSSEISGIENSLTFISTMPTGNMYPGIQGQSYYQDNVMYKCISANSWIKYPVTGSW